MRLELLDKGHAPVQKLQLGAITALMGRVPPPILLMSYRRDHFGRWLAPCFHEAMREAKEWTAADTELFAAFVSSLNKCRY